MNRDQETTFQNREQYLQNRFQNHAAQNPYSDAYNQELRPARLGSQENAPVDGASRSSGMGPQVDRTREDGSSDSRARILRGSLESSQGIVKQNQPFLLKKSSDDLTLEMLGPSNKQMPITFTSFQPHSDGQKHQQLNNQGLKLNSKGPPSSALDLHSELYKDQSSHTNSLKQNENSLSLEQYRQNNQNLQQILNQLDSTPQFNSAQISQNLASLDVLQDGRYLKSNQNNFGSGRLTGQPLTSEQGSRPRNNGPLAQIKEVNEVKPFSYNLESSAVPPQSRPARFENEQANVQNYGKLKDDFNKINLMQTIQNQPQGQPSYKRTELQYNGSQIVQNENKNGQNWQRQANASNLIVERTKSTPAPAQNDLLNQHKQIMKHFDEIPISKIKTMVGYQTNPDMYNSDAKVKEVLPEVPAQPELQNVEQQNRKRSLDGEESEEDEGSGPLEERVSHTLWKVRSRAFKEINQHFYNDYAKNQSDPSHPMTSFDQFGPLLQEMIKDTNLTNAFEALQCLHSYVRFSSDIKAITFASHNYLLEKIQTNKPNFRDITLKILIGMLRRDQGANCLYPEILKRFRTKNSKCAHFCMLVIIEAFKTKEQHVIQDMNLRQVFKSIQESITHHNKDLREASYIILKNICERCKDDPAALVGNCKNLRPVQIKELTEELQKIEKSPTCTQVILEQSDQWDDNPVKENNNQAKPPKSSEATSHAAHERNDDLKQQLPVKPIEQEFYDLLTLLPDDFSEIPYTQQINTKKKSMELFNTELSKILEKGSSAVIKQKDYSIIFNTVLHMLEDKNMLVFLEAIKALELLATLQQMKAGKAKTFMTALVGKYGETKTAVIAATDKAMAAIVLHSLSPTAYSDICINQIASTHKNPRVKQFIITNAITNMLKSMSNPEQENFSDIISVFRKIEKELIKLILKDTNNTVRDAVVQLIVDFGQTLQSDQNAFQSVIAAIQVLPKYRIAEITGKLRGSQPEEVIAPQQQQFSKTINNPSKVQSNKVEEEFSKTLVPSAQQTDLKAQPAESKQLSVLDTIRQMETGKGAEAQPLFIRLQSALKNETAYLVKNNEQITQGLLQLCLSKSKALNKPNIANILAAFYKDVLTIGPLKLSKADIEKTLKVILIIASHQTDTELLNELLSLIMSAFSDVRDFCDQLREVIEMDQVIEHYRAITIITIVYQWLGQKLPEFMQMGMDTVEIEELRGFGIKYLESTHLFGEQQRQQLIQVMINFKDQVMQIKSAALQTLGEALIESSASSIPTNKMETATWRPQTHEEEESEVINADLICKTIDTKFEQGLLMFKELAQSNQSLDFETKEQIFNKLIMIVAESQRSGNAEQQQYRQAYALKALMWMKEETMGLEDTFKLTSKVMSVYVQQVVQENDASVEVYLLNFWVKDLSIRDLADRISVCVTNFKVQESRNSNRSHRQSSNLSEPQQEAFRVMFTWFDEQWLTPQAEKWRLSDLRKIALFICESVSNQRNKLAVELCKKFIKHCVERESQEKVLEFMEIQLMQSKDVFISFSDWFQSIYPFKIQAVKAQQLLISQVDLKQVSAAVSQEQQITPRSQTEQQTLQALSYMERRQQMKAQNVRKSGKDDFESSQNQMREMIEKIERIKTPLAEPTETVQESQQIMRQTNTSNYNKSQRSRYEEPSSSEEKDEQEMYVESEQVQVVHQRVPSAISQNRDIYERVQQSEVKQQVWMQKIMELETEKERIESETAQLQKQKNQESQVWQQKLQRMQSEHQNVVANLTEVNQCYQQQVEENESLKKQLSSMQKQHNDMMVRFEQIEMKINSRETVERVAPATPPRLQQVNLASREHLTMSVAKLQRISETFSLVDQKIGIQKIQELLLSVERNVDGELAQPLISHYVKIRTLEERLTMIQAVNQALTVNEDVLLALSFDVYKAMLNFLLRAFAHEKERLDTESIGGHQKLEQNEVTMKSQHLVSRLLNSKEFTTSLVSLFQLLREAMPSDLSLHLPIEDTQYLRVLMRCIMRITKALHSEASDLVRGFDVLIEMQKIFLKCPPENLREDLPCLADFDFVFRGMKDVSDRLVELQPDKVQSFLSFTENKAENAFIKYMRQASQQLL